MRLNTTIELSDLIKGIAAFIAAAIVFFSITLAEKEISTKELQLELAREIPKLIPLLRNNYTNQVENNTRLKIRAVIRVTSDLPTYIFPPEIKLLDQSGIDIPNSDYQVIDSNQFSGLFAPDSIYHITYNVELSENLKTDGLLVSMTYLAEMPDSLKKVYNEIYEDIPDAKWESVSDSWSLNYIYKEKVYDHGENPIWSDFWDNPR